MEEILSRPAISKKMLANWRFFALLALLLVPVAAFFAYEGNLAIVVLFGIFVFFAWLLKKGPFVVLAALILATPFDYYDVLYIFSASDILLMLLASMCLCQLCLRDRNIRWSPLFSWMIILNIAFCASAIGSEDLLVMLRTQVTSFMILMLSFLVVQYVSGRKQFEQIFYCFILAGCVQCILGYVQYIAYSWYNVNLWKTDTLVIGSHKFFRLHGVYGDPNYLIFYLIVPLILCFVSLKNSFLFRRAERIFVWFGIVTILPAYVLTFSRTGFLLLVFAFILLAWSEGCKRTKVSLVLAFPLIVTSFAVLLYFLVKIKITSVLGRLSANLAAWNTFLENPFTGIGLGVSVFDPLSGVKIGPHNAYLYVLATTGLIGFLPFLMVVLLLVRECRSAPKKIKELKQKVICKGFYYALICMLFGLLTLDAIFMKHFWIVVALLISLGQPSLSMRYFHVRKS